MADLHPTAVVSGQLTLDVGEQYVERYWFLGLACSSPLPSARCFDQR